MSDTSKELRKPRTPKTASLTHERQYLAFGCRNIVGLDEAGRGAWAGPVAAGAVCLPLENRRLSDLLAGVRDSKQLSPGQRAALVDRIKETAVAWGVGSASSYEIDDLGINPATRLAMKRALEALALQKPDFAPDCLLLDSMPWPDAPLQCRLVSIVHGDRLSLSIAAASILAKVWRDQHMTELEAQYQGYRLSLHKGYGTAQHQAALKALGPSAIHRHGYGPIRALLSEPR
jgi:ribonuclease HII